MAHMIHRTGCCGVKEVRGIQTTGRNAEDTLIILGYDFFDDAEDCAILLFTENGQKRYKDGHNIRDYIIKHGLGTVIETEPKYNPNSGNRVKAYLWTIDIPAFSKWYKTKAKSQMRRELLAQDEMGDDDDDDDFWED